MLGKSRHIDIWAGRDRNSKLRSQKTKHKHEAVYTTTKPDKGKNRNSGLLQSDPGLTPPQRLAAGAGSSSGAGTQSPAVIAPVLRQPRSLHAGTPAAPAGPLQRDPVTQGPDRTRLRSPGLRAGPGRGIFQAPSGNNSNPPPLFFFYFSA